MRVQWVHPTWRDLVITQLAGDETARRQFLHRCGVYGIELALSTANDAADARRLPLIACDGDWDAVTDRLFELAAELEPTELLALLACLGQAIEALEGCREALEAHAMARTTLSRVAALWDAAGSPIPLVQLAAWLEVAGLLDAPPKLPHLSLTWVELLPASVPEPDDRAAVERFADWLALCEELWAYSIELKTQLGYNDEQVELMASFVGRVELHKSLPRPEAEQVMRALELIAMLEPDLQPLARFVGRDFGTTEGPPSGLAPDFPEPPPPELFEVQRVLADL